MVFLQYNLFRTLKLNVFKSRALYFMQSKCFSPICFRICIFRSLHWTYHVPHFRQIKHFYLQCVTICVFRRCFRCENPLTHILQLNEFSQVCLLVCFYRLPLFHIPCISMVFLQHILAYDTEVIFSVFFLPCTPCRLFHKYVSRLLKVNDVVTHVCAKMSRICAKLLLLNAVKTCIFFY